MEDIDSVTAILMELNLTLCLSLYFQPFVNAAVRSE